MGYYAEGGDSFVPKDGVLWGVDESVVDAGN